MLYAYGTRGGRFAPFNQLLRTERFIPGLIAFNVLILAWGVCAGPATAAEQPTAAGPGTSVAVEALQASDHYEVERVYGGEVRARRASTLGFRHAGTVQAVYVDEGDRVAAGTVLAALDPEPFAARLAQARATLAHAEAGVRVAEAALELARETTRRHADLVERGHTSRQRFDELRLDLVGREAQVDVAEAAREQSRANLEAAVVDLDRSRITAPYAGRVQSRMVDEGSIVVPGQAALRLLESDAREARIGLPGDLALELEAGSRFRLRSGNRESGGTLLHILPELDGQTRSATALFELDDATLPAGTLIELRLLRSVQEPGYWVPLGALAEAQRGLWSIYVLAETEAGTVTERRLVEVIHTRADRVFVRGTLRDGERIVSTGTQRIVPGQRVSVVDADVSAAGA